MTALAEKLGVESSGCRPFLRWPGGKSKLLPELVRRLPDGFRAMQYYEPFIGGAALFFHLAPTSAILTDTNADLISTYESVRDAPDMVISKLHELANAHASNPEAHYASVRAAYNAKQRAGSWRAAAFIYLNKACFNGIYRTNRAGEFNVPSGKRKTVSVDEVGIRAASVVLQRAMMQAAPFEKVLNLVKEGDFAYLDPPYLPKSPTANFTAYTADGFTEDDHIMLAGMFRRAAKRGAKLMLSNADVPLARELYEGFRIEEVAGPRCVGAAAETRGFVKEILVRNY